MHYASPLHMIFMSLACAHEHVHVQNILRDFPQAKLDSEINSPFLLNKHGDPWRRRKNIFFWNYRIWCHILIEDPKRRPHPKNQLWIAILNGDIRDQSLIVSHTNPSKFVLVPSVWNQLKIREIYMGQYQTFILYISAGNYN